MEDLDCDDGDIEEYIAVELSYLENSAMGVSRAWFDQCKFRKMLDDPSDDEIVHRVLDYLESRDLSARNSYLESGVDNQDDDDFANYFLNNPRTSYGWYLLKKKRQYLRLWLITNFWWKEAGKNQHIEGGRGRIRSRKEFEAEYHI